MCIQAVEAQLPNLPIELWVEVFKYLTPESLLRCQGVCRAWREEVLFMVHTGKVPRLGLRMERLAWNPAVLKEYRRSTWESISVKADSPILLVGVGVYAPSGETTICVDARPLEPELRPIDVATELDSSYEDQDRIITLFGSQHGKKPFRFRLEADQWWEIVLNIKPVTGRLSSGTVWSGGGDGGREEIKVHGVNFSFRNTIRDSWRSDYTEGQFPVLYFWRL